MRILLLAPSNPMSTSAYYERAFRHNHDVLTCGPMLGETILDAWAQGETRHALKAPGAGQHEKIDMVRRLLKPCDLPTAWGAAPVLPQDWQPDLVVWVDGGERFTPPVDVFDCPTACLLGDTHLRLEWRADYARGFDHTFIQFHREDIATIEAMGIENVHWLPPACEPLTHCPGPAAKAYDVVFIGQTDPEYFAWRVDILKRFIAAGLDVVVSSHILQEMALLYSRARIVFNCSIAGDLNMRVPEAMASGSMLLTDRLGAESGMDELFTDRVDLVLYDNRNVVDLARYYLANHVAREAIALSGRDRALRLHTYAGRASQIVRDCGL